MAVDGKKQLTAKQLKELLGTLELRFKNNSHRHKSLQWDEVKARLDVAASEKLWSLHEMEKTGGEPDVIEKDKRTGEYVFYDCSAESPDGRRSFCYDDEALKSRKEN